MSSSRRAARGAGHCRSLLLPAAALAALSAGCDERFDFDVPTAVALADSGASAAPAGCSSDKDCALASLHCDVSVGRCFECVVDEDCTQQSGQRCDSAQNRCVECKVTRDCALGSACDTTTHRCLRSCVEEVDCAPSDHDCDERRGVCIQCDEDAECTSRAEGGYCALDGTGCLECRVEAHCVAGSRCDLVLGRCVACRDSRDCAADSFCDPGAHTCVPARSAIGQ
ncbi:MAG: hypothetical protein ABI895_22805 [Deltaproteobacteria bacterium]